MKCPHCGQEFSDDLRSDFCPSCGGRFSEQPTEPPEKPEFGEEDLFAEDAGPGGEGPSPEKPAPEKPETEGEGMFPGEEPPLFTAEPSEPETEEAYYCPWEDRERLGLFAAWWETTKKVLFNPGGFYRGLAPTGKMGDAILFAVIWLIIAGVVSAVYGLIFQGAQLGLMNALGQGGLQSQEFPFSVLGTGGSLAGSFLTNLVCTPAVGIFLLIILAGVYHLFLLVVKGATEPYEASLRVVCYATCSMIWVLIPLCGSIIGSIYRIVLAIIGLNEVHKSGGGKAAAAVLIPYALCITCVLAVIAVVIGSGALQHGFPSR